MVLHAIDDATNSVQSVLLTNRKLNIVSSEIETKLQTIADNTANININVSDVEINVNDLEVLQTATNVKLDALISANHVDLVAVADATDGIETLLTNLDTAQDLTNTKLTQVVSNTSGMSTTRNANNSWINSVALSAFGQHGTPLDNASTYKSVSILGSSSSGNSAFVMGSHDNVNWFIVKEMYPYSYNMAFHFNATIENSPRYITISAGSSGDTYTFHAEQQTF